MEFCRARLQLLHYLQYSEGFRRLEGPETLRRMLKQINNYIFPDETPFDRPRPPLVMKSHEIKFLECASGLGSAGAKPRMDARGSHLIPNSCSAGCGAGAGENANVLAPARAGTFEKRGPDPPGVMTQAVNAFWHIWSGKAPVILLTAARVSYSGF